MGLTCPDTPRRVLTPEEEVRGARSPAPWNPWRVWWLRWLHLRRVQQARPVNPNFTIHCDSLGLFYVLDFQPKLLLSIWAPILNHFQLLLFFPQYRKDNFLLKNYV